MPLVVALDPNSDSLRAISDHAISAFAVRACLVRPSCVPLDIVADLVVASCCCWIAACRHIGGQRDVRYRWIVEAAKGVRAGETRLDLDRMPLLVVAMPDAPSSCCDPSARRERWCGVALSVCAFEAFCLRVA